MKKKINLNPKKQPGLKILRTPNPKVKPADLIRSSDRP